MKERLQLLTLIFTNSDAHLSLSQAVIKTSIRYTLTNERAERKQHELNEKKSSRSIKCMSESAHSASYDSFYRFHFGRLSVPLPIQMDFWRNDPVMKYFDLLFDYWRPVHFCRRRKSKTTKNFIRCQRAWSFRKRETNNS